MKNSTVYTYSHTLHLHHGLARLSILSVCYLRANMNEKKRTNDPSIKFMTKIHNWINMHLIESVKVFVLNEVDRFIFPCYLYPSIVVVQSPFFIIFFCFLFRFVIYIQPSYKHDKLSFFLHFCVHINIFIWTMKHFFSIMLVSLKKLNKISACNFHSRYWKWKKDLKITWKIM